MVDDSMHLMFVYGTLKMGEPNWAVMEDPSNGVTKFLGNGKTVNRFPLVVATDYWVPFLLREENKGHQIHGQIFEVDDTKRDFLDDFEGHPTLYERLKIEITLTHDANSDPINPPTVIECWTYFLCQTKEDFLQLKYICNYKSISDDHKPYVSSENLQDFSDLNGMAN